MVRYMDDICIFTRAIREGSRWWEGTLCYTEQWRIEDQKDGISSPARTLRVLVAIMDVYDFLGFTPEIGEGFTDLKLPTLDILMWIKDGLIEYEFHEKP